MHDRFYTWARHQSYVAQAKNGPRIHVIDFAKYTAQTRDMRNVSHICSVYIGTNDVLSWIAFLSDGPHEVLPVKSGN